MRRRSISLLINVMFVLVLAAPAMSAAQQKKPEKAVPADAANPGLWHTFGDFIGPDFKALESIWAEGSGDGNIGRVAALRDEHASNSGHVASWIECVPGAT